MQLDAVQTNISLADAYREGLISEDELREASGEDFGLIVDASAEAAALLVDAFGGTRVYVPVSLDEDSPLAEVLGEKAHAVVDLLRGSSLDVPKLMRLRRAIRQRKIDALDAAGWSASQLALHFNLTERQVYVLLRRSRKERLSTAHESNVKGGLKRCL